MYKIVKYGDDKILNLKGHNQFGMNLVHFNEQVFIYNAQSSFHIIF